MANLKDLLQPERVVEFNYQGTPRLGIVEVGCTRVRTAQGYHCISDMDDRLIGLNSYITKVYVYNADGSELNMLWDRDRDFIDWTKVPVDTKIVVRASETEVWRRRYFAKYEYGRVYAFENGLTSFTANTTTYWQYAKLYREEEEV